MTRIRSPRGAAIIGGTALVLLVSTLGAGLLFLITNASAISSEHQQLQCIGQEAARQIAFSKYWLGMERPDYESTDRGAAEEKAKESVNAELSALGLPPCGNFQVRYDKGFVRDIEIAIVRVDFDVMGVRLMSGAPLPELMNLHIAASSSDSEHAARKHALALMLFVGPDGTQRGIRVPIYNATVGNNMALDQETLRAGPAVGNFPNAFFKLKSEQQTWIHEQEQ